MLPIGKYCAYRQEDSYEDDFDLREATKNFTKRVRKWNTDVFGNVFAKKRRVLARINGVQKSLANNPGKSLLHLEKQLIEEYASILLQEEFWALKSRLNAATFEDQITTFFHISTVVHRHRNKN